MLRKITVTLFILICFILQCSVFGSLAFAGIIPNLMIILTSAFGFMRGETEGLLIGFFCGLLTDIFFGEFLGFYALLTMYIGYVNGKFSRIFYPEDIKLPLVLIILSDLSYGIICYILTFMLRGRLQFVYYFTHIILPETLYTIVVTLLLYPAVLKVNQKLEAYEKRRAQKFV
ncbi:rod shape-determining protein MreD [Acetatifactor muris]|uniref:Rod shape-determining protein MreD n=1 Tax=Acetatifactor muris TaxID=879566 RepID=A0A2K4ZJJ7_9FIRM|nr:rod shape-determining protein MreD [Acetatifactor muris]MCR2048940.1 rod shape-determining protein MreD [Acetatifactor muris]SOY30649.1 rod shape-determining protein MreD [Acetatifactor muris]